MRKISFIFAIAVAVTVASCTGGGQKEQKTNEGSDTETLGNVSINPTESMVAWKAGMLGMYNHEGTINLIQADIEMKDGNISGGSFSIDMSTITPTDQNFNPEEGKSKEKLVGHLSSADFFDVGNHPTATFKISGINGSTATGILTVRGISNEEKVENINITKEGNQVKISGDLVFDRKTYDVVWDSPMKEMVLSNDITIRVELVGIEG